MNKFDKILDTILIGALIYLPFAGFKGYKQWILEEETLKNRQHITQLQHERESSLYRLESDRQISSASFQDISLDGTNELIVADKSGRETTLFLYDSKSNQYFSAETIREMKANELENQMRSYTNDLEATK